MQRVALTLAFLALVASAALAVDICPNFNNLGYSCGACVPGAATVECSADRTPAALGWGKKYLDGASSNLAFVDNVVAGVCQHTFTVNRLWNGNVCKNSGFSQVQAISVRDTTKPTISLNGPAVINVGPESEGCGQVPAFSASVVNVADNCDTSVAVTYSDTPFTCGQPLTRTITATDKCGNSASVTQTINVACCGFPNCQNGVREFLCAEGRPNEYYSCWTPYESLFRPCPPGTRCVNPGRYTSLTTACCPQGYD